MQLKRKFRIINRNRAINRYPVFFLLIGLLISMDLDAQQYYTLGDLVNQALRENYQIRMVRKEASIASNNNTLGVAGFLPTINAGAEGAASNSNAFTRLFSGETRGGENAQSRAISAFVEVNWIVFDGLSMFARKDQLGHLERLGVLQTRYYLEQTVSDLAKAYYQLILERQLLENFRESLEISTFRRDLERQKLEIGTGTGLLFRQAIVDFNSDSATVIHQKAVVRGLEIQLNRLINRQLEAEIIPTREKIPFSQLADKDSLIIMASRSNRDIMDAQIQEMIADAGYREESGRRFPEVSLFGNYAYTRQTNEVGLAVLNRNYGPQVGVRVRFNLYDGNQQNIRVRNASIEKKIAGLERQDTELLVEATLLETLNHYESLGEQLELMALSLTSATEALEIAQRQLAAGAINGYDFRLTQLALLQVKNNLIGLSYQQKNREIDIMRLTGSLMEMEM